jgi:hypothetical protein
LAVVKHRSKEINFRGIGTQILSPCLQNMTFRGEEGNLQTIAAKSFFEANTKAAKKFVMIRIQDLESKYFYMERDAAIFYY